MVVVSVMIFVIIYKEIGSDMFCEIYLIDIGGGSFVWGVWLEVVFILGDENIIYIFLVIIVL